MPCILIIDDNDSIRKLLGQILEKARYEVMEASDGIEGQNLFRKKPADLVICDIFMPKKEGLTTLIELKREFPDVKSIAISGGGRHADLSYLNDALVFGAHRSLAKPIDRQELLETVNELIGPGATTSE